MSFDRAEIELSGSVDIARLVSDLPQVDPGVGSGTGNDPFGDARINLRGLGDVRTLVLVNGRRYAPSSIFGAADLNALPPVLVERVEVVTGGGSAVYGSDAIAGAVNFILRDDFEGYEGGIQYGVTERGDGDTWNLDVAWGSQFADSRGNLALFANFFRREVVFQDARAYSAIPLTGDDDTGEVVSDASFVSGAGAIDGQLGVDFYTFETDGAPRLFVDPDDRFNTTSFNALLAPLERFSVNAIGHFDVAANTRTKFELSYSRSEHEQRRPDAFAGFVAVNVDRPDISPALSGLLASAYDPDGDGISTFRLLRRFSPERGDPVLVNDRDYFRGLLGATGDIGRSWRWSADYSYSSVSTDQSVVNDSSISRIQQGLLVDAQTGQCFDPSNGCVPVNPFGPGNVSPAASTFIALPDTGSTGGTTEQIANITLSGPLFSTWAGAVDLATGLEYRRTESELTPTESVLTGDSLFYGSDVASNGTISLFEAFAEARLPLAEGLPFASYLGLEAGLRYSDYNIIDDGLTTWKIGAEWQIVDSLRLRIMQQRAIRAPSAAELFQEPAPAGLFFALGPIFDQCSASRDPVGNGLTDLCTAQGIPADQVGVFEASFFPTAVDFASNPNLDAEEADTFTAGVVWQPEIARSMSMSVDYFRIDIDNATTIVFPNDAVTLCFLTRDPTDPFCSTFARGQSNNIESSTITFVNAAEARSEGIDLALDWRLNSDTLALFDGDNGWGVSFVATHYLEAGFRGSPLTPFFDCAGKFGAFCNNPGLLGALPELRTNTRISYFSGPLTVSLRWQHIGEMQSAENEFREASGRPPAELAVERAGTVDYFDLTLDAVVGRHWNLRAGVVNLLDETPPFLGSGNQDANTDPRTYDTLGRRFFVRVSAGF